MSDVECERQVVMTAKATPDGLIRLAQVWREQYPSMALWGALVEPQGLDWAIKLTLQKKEG